MTESLYATVRLATLKAIQDHYPALLYFEALEIAEAAARKADSGARLASRQAEATADDLAATQ